MKTATVKKKPEREFTLVIEAPKERRQFRMPTKTINSKRETRQQQRQRIKREDW